MQQASILKFILAFILISSSLIGQNKTVIIDDKQITLLDDRYSFQDTVQKKFVKINSAEIWKMRTNINKVPFDHCNHNELDLLLYVDTTGVMQFVQIITGTTLPKLDSAIISILADYSKKFKTVPSNHSLIYIKYQFHNKRMEEMLANTQGNYGMSDVLLKFNSLADSILNPDLRKKSSECDDDAFFYDAGVKSYQQGDFKKAVYNFLQAVNSNPFDMDANYNLGLSYQKTDKMKKACECFAKGMEVGEASSVKAFNKFCSAPKSK